MWRERQDPDSDDHHDDSVSSAISCRPRRVNNRHVANDRRPHVVSVIGTTQSHTTDVLLSGWSTVLVVLVANDRDENERVDGDVSRDVNEIMHQTTCYVAERPSAHIKLSI